MNLGLSALVAVVFLITGLGCEFSSKRQMGIAEKRMDQGDYLGAAREYEQLVEDFPKSRLAGEAYYWLGTLYQHYLDDPKRGLESFQLLVEHFPDHQRLPLALYSMGELYERHFQKSRLAIATYQRLVSDHRDEPLSEKSQLRIAEIYFDLGELDQARMEWEHLIQKHPEGNYSDEALYRIAGTYYIQESYDEAFERYQRLVREFPQSDFFLEAKYRMGNCLEETRQYSEALEIYEKILETYPNRAVLEMRIKEIRKHKPLERSSQPTGILDKKQALG